MICWQMGWCDFDLREREQFFVCELQREIASNPHHPLFNKALRVIASRYGTDDFIFQFIDESGYVYVHLTWQCETDPTFPWCRFIANDDALNAFLIGMSPDD